MCIANSRKLSIDAGILPQPALAFLRVLVDYTTRVSPSVKVIPLDLSEVSLCQLGVLSGLTDEYWPCSRASHCIQRHPHLLRLYYPSDLECSDPASGQTAV